MQLRKKLFATAIAACAVAAAHGSTPYALSFAKLIDNGSSLKDLPIDMAVDAAGNMYVLSETDITNKHWWYVNKIDPAGALVWTQGSYGATDSVARSIACDALGNVAVSVDTRDGNASYNAVVFMLDANGNPTHVPQFADPGGKVAAGWLVNYDNANILHALVETITPNDEISTSQISANGVPSALMNVLQIQEYQAIKAPNGGFVVSGSNKTGELFGYVDGSGAFLFGDQQVSSYVPNPFDEVYHRDQFGVDANGGVQVSINRFHLYQGGETDTYTYRCYDSNGNILWHYDNQAGAAYSVCPISATEGYYMSLANGVQTLHDVTNVGDKWSLTVPGGAYCVADDMGGVFVISPQTSGAVTGFSILKLDPSGNVQFLTSYFPPNGVKASARIAKVQKGSLYLYGYAENGATGRDLLLIKLVQGIALSQIGLSTPSTTGPSTVNGTLKLDAVAPAGGYLAYLASSNPTVAGVPAQVVIPAGSLTGNFNCVCSAVDAAQWVTITGQAHGASSTTTLLVQPSILSSVVMNTPSVKVGTNGTGTVNLSGITGNSGRVITLLSSNPAKLQVLPTMYIAPGQASGTFSVKAVSGAGSQFTVTASWGNVSKVAPVSVIP